jgi:WXG100 family type VII secretion target
MGEALMESLRVSPQTLLEEKSRCKQHAYLAEGVYQQLSGAIHACPSWTGESHPAFQQLWTQWGPVLNDIHVAFEQLGGYLNEAALVYQQTDENMSLRIHGETR